MTKITNTPKMNDDDCINKCRAAIHHRGLWMGLMIQEAKDMGLDWEAIARNAIKKCGHIHGKGILEAMQNKKSLVDFGNAFFTDHIKKIFEIDVKQIDEDTLKLEYHYCPLLKAWTDIGMDGEFLDKVCDAAMCGDRGISEVHPDFRFELGKTLAQGHSVCEVSFYRNK